MHVSHTPQVASRNKRGYAKRKHKPRRVTKAMTAVEAAKVTQRAHADATHRRHEYLEHVGMWPERNLKPQRKEVSHDTQ